MLRYPLNVSKTILTYQTHHNNLDFYSTQWPNGNAMYWSMFTIGYSDLGLHSTADHYLTKSTTSNLYGPFKIWTENPDGSGCPNFLTGAGVYLQSLWAGYGGVRFRDDSLLIKAPEWPQTAPTSHELGEESPMPLHRSLCGGPPFAQHLMLSALPLLGLYP